MHEKSALLEYICANLMNKHCAIAYISLHVLACVKVPSLTNKHSDKRVYAVDY